MRLSRFTLGNIVSIGLCAVIFIVALKFVAARFPNLPVIAPVARTV
jgi:hypothetical protein